MYQIKQLNVVEFNSLPGSGDLSGMEYDGVTFGDAEHTLITPSHMISLIESHIDSCGGASVSEAKLISLLETIPCGVFICLNG